MKAERYIRWLVALAALAAVPAVWVMTVSPYDSEVGGLYSFSRALFNLAMTAIGLSAAYVLVGKAPMKPKLQSVALGGLSIGVCLALLEVPGLFLGIDNQKLFGRPGDKTAQHLSEGVNKRDPVLIHLHWPNSSFSGEITGNLAGLGIPRPPRHKVDVRYDRNGFRNDRAFDRADIAVIGDSFIEAAIVAREQSLVGRLEARLGVPTVNLGQIAYGPRQELEVLKRFALPLSPKVVVWAFFGGNDLRDMPYYEQRLRNYANPPPVPLKDRLFLRNALVAGGGLLAHLHSLTRSQPTEKALDHSGLFKRADGVTERVYFGGNTPAWTPHQWQVAVDTLRQAHTLARANDAVLLVVYIPRKFGIYRDRLSLSPDREIAKWAVNDLGGALGKWCVRNGIPFIDTSPHLARIVASGQHPYFIDDVHWNPLGHEIVAGAIIDHLSRSSLLSRLRAKRRDMPHQQ